MKKFFYYLIFSVIVISLLIGIYFCVSYFINKRYENVYDSSTPISIPISEKETNNNAKTYTFFDNSPKISFNTSFGPLLMNSITKNWKYQLNTNIWKTILEEKSISENNNTINDLSQYIGFSYDYDPDLIILNIYNNNGVVVFSKQLDNNNLPILQSQDNYTYVLDIIWNEPNAPYHGQYTYTFNLFIDLPVYFEFDKTTISQGEFVKVCAYNVNDNQIPVLKQSLFDKFKFFKKDYTYVGYIPASYYKSEGTYPVEYGIKDQQLLKTSIEVKKYDFNIQYLYIDKNLAAATKNVQSSAEYTKYFIPVRQQSNAIPYYSLPFVIPAYGHLSTEFGENRYVNGTPTSYHHSGLDIGAPLLSPIYATNEGKVVLAMNLIMTGNTIVIDHGMGLFSVYFHMDSLLVDVEDMVNRGQQIGLMGTTGFSTGSHLHFTMSIFDTNIEPGYFLVGEPITRQNYLKYLSK